MKIIRTVEELRTWRKSLPKEARVGFVPTMGALHAGHLSLVAKSLGECDETVVSIYVNPTQFGPNEDFSRYPRPFEKDSSLLESVGVSTPAGTSADSESGPKKVSVLFAPETLYAPGSSTFVVEEAVSQPLCGKFRPGHFRGVATVVLKLFNQVQPHIAYFGQKDAQQCAVIERMVRDLDLDVRIVRGETLREADGLAMSSRNIYLSPAQREKATLIYRSMRDVAEALKQGERNVAKLTRIGRGMLESEPEFKIQYWEIRHPSSLESMDTVGRDGALIAVAAYLGTTRLIDNLSLTC